MFKNVLDNREKR
jgi:5-methylcytosine-specific restriction endonuclease McrBC regulatory subunit McrC